MARVRLGRGSTLTGIALAIAVLCTACAPASRGTEEEQTAEVAAAVTAAGERVTQASAEKSIDGMSWGWTVDVVLSGSDPVTPDELSALLLAARHAGDLDPGHVDLFATDETGASFDLTAAADELGLRYSDIGAGIGVPSDLLDDALGTEG